MQSLQMVIPFLPRSKCLLILWLQSPSAVILEPPKIKSETVSTVSPFISHEVMGPDAMILKMPNIWASLCRRAKRSYSTFKVRRGGREKIPLVQGKEQWLRFAGAAAKRYPTSEVRETQVRR